MFALLKTMNLCTKYDLNGFEKLFTYISSTKDRGVHSAWLKRANATKEKEKNEEFDPV